MRYYTWARRGGYEVSSKGDKRFSAFYAILPNGNSIEFEYQVNIKQYTSIAEGKGKPPRKVVANLFEAYLALWQAFFVLNPHLLEELKTLVKPHGNCFSDMFSNTPINQARAIATILNRQVPGEKRYHYHTDGTQPSKSIFVFGSNLSGIHGAGAALLAREVYGAELGIAEGLIDCRYAIPTVDFLEHGAPRQTPLSLQEISQSIETFKQVAIVSSKGPGAVRFFVSRIGCGLAGYTDKEIAPLFRNSPVNCSFAESWMAYTEPSEMP